MKTSFIWFRLMNWFITINYYIFKIKNAQSCALHSNSLNNYEGRYFNENGLSLLISRNISWNKVWTKETLKVITIGCTWLNDSDNEAISGFFVSSLSLSDSVDRFWYSNSRIQDWSIEIAHFNNRPNIYSLFIVVMQCIVVVKSLDCEIRD